MLARHPASLAIAGALLAGGASVSAAPQSTAEASAPTLRAVRLTEPLLIDGRLVEDAWALAPAADHFVQRDPDEGKPGTERTEVRLLFDNDALYVGVRMHDGSPHEIARRLSARDADPDADTLTILLDPRHDHRTGVRLAITAAGVQLDAAISNDTNEDSTWDAVWTSAVSIDALGWTVEVRVPFSQLRLDATEQTWGFNVSRFIRRKNETAWLHFWPKNDNGLSSKMMHLVGLDAVQPRRQFELAPYTAVRQEYLEREAGDPFNDGARTFGSIGLDLRASLAAGLVIDATVNPDFGQAEVDPAVVNLTAYETFFPEKRRFFIEGSEVFRNFGQGGTNSIFGFNSSNPNLYYSRRIGRTPVVEADGDFVEHPRSTTILGAVKLTGKTPGGWSIGALDAVTASEHARQSIDTRRDRTAVEPLTNYFAVRVHRDFLRGGAGLLTTSVTRRLDSSLLEDELPSRAFVVGGDGYLFLDSRKDWVVTGEAAASHVGGSATAIHALQEASQRYYQRPDAAHLSLDPARTSLSGFSGRVLLNRNSGVWRVNAALWGVSPGFESNDFGFHTRGDRSGAHGVLLWRKQSPDRFTRSRGWWLAKAWTWNFNREVVSNIVMGCGNALLSFYWHLNSCAGRAASTLQDDLTRGGPLARTPRSNWANVSVSSDGRKPLSFDLWAGHDWNPLGGFATNGELAINVKPLPSLSVSIGPSLHRSKDLAQYIDTEDDATAARTYGQRYLFGTLDQTRVTLHTRVNWIFSPRTSLQVYMQPLIAAGRYPVIKELAAPRTFAFREYGAAGSTLAYDPDNRSYTIDPDENGPAPAFSLDNPDFNFRSLRVNAIFRWEFRPGSTLYAVWTEQREDDEDHDRFSARRDLSRLFRARSDDVFLLKLTYWMGR